MRELSHQKHITLVFSHDNKDWISRAMAWLTHSQYTHVSLLHPDGMLAIEASGVSHPRGVHIFPAERAAAKPNSVIRRIAHPNPHAVWRAAETQNGKPYDWKYLFGWLLRKNWQNKDKWVCHELIAWACVQAGYPVIDMSASEWLTPQHLYLLSKPLDAACINQERE